MGRRDVSMPMLFDLPRGDSMGSGRMGVANTNQCDAAAILSTIASRTRFASAGGSSVVLRSAAACFIIIATNVFVIWFVFSDVKFELLS